VMYLARFAGLDHEPDRGAQALADQVMMRGGGREQRRAQMEIDLRPELYKHYHLRSVPEKYRDQVDVRAFGTGERIVFLEYTRENFEATRQWTQAHDLFSGPPSAGYDQAALV